MNLKGVTAHFSLPTQNSARRRGGDWRLPMDVDEMAFSFTGFSEEAKQEIGGWEPALAPLLLSEENVRSWEMVSALYHDCSIFPPYLHEGLHIPCNPDQTPTPLSPSPQEPIKGTALEPYLSERHKEEEESGQASKSLSESAQRIVVSWFEVIRSKVSGTCGGRAEAVGLGVCSFAALVGVIGFLMYFRRRHQREKEFFLFLIQEKNQEEPVLPILFMKEDLFVPILLRTCACYERRSVSLLKFSPLFPLMQKIELLLHQIAELNAVLAAHRKVSVLKRT